ncbi:MAG: YggT family protein [Micrococcus sp.]|nr:YggT family protein [Micrococcus sp.]
MSLIYSLLYILLTVVQVALLGRFVVEIVQSFVRDWRPRGLVLVAASAIYTVTDRPVLALRRRIPPLQIGGVALDLAVIILYFLVILAKVIVQALAL